MLENDECSPPSRDSCNNNTGSKGWVWQTELVFNINVFFFQYLCSKGLNKVSINLIFFAYIFASIPFFSHILIKARFHVTLWTQICSQQLCGKINTFPVHSQVFLLTGRAGSVARNVLHCLLIKVDQGKMAYTIASLRKLCLLGLCIVRVKAQLNQGWAQKDASARNAT